MFFIYNVINGEIMIRSMTGYGTASSTLGDISCTTDIRSVNNRYLDINIRNTSALYQYEKQFKSVIKDYVKRGKVDVYIKINASSSENVTVRINENLLSKYLQAANRLEQDYSVKNDLLVSHFVANTEIFEIIEDDSEEVKQAFLQCALNSLNSSLEVFLKSKEIEGEQLYKDLKAKAKYVEEQVLAIKHNIREYDEQLKDYYFTRTRKLADDFTLDRDRLYTEVAVLIDKSCIDEELVRLLSHINQFSEVLDSEGSVGKRLDFIVQEMNREANTILSKSKSSDLSKRGLNIKTEIEKIREQVQNIE